MSDGKKAAAEDDEDWYYLCKKAGIEDVKWSTYSKEARYAKEAYSSLGLKGNLLKEYVALRVRIDELIKEQKILDDEFNLYLKLKQKYERA